MSPYLDRPPRTLDEACRDLAAGAYVAHQRRDPARVLRLAGRIGALRMHQEAAARAARCGRRIVMARIFMNQPQPGYWLIRLVRRGPLVPVMIAGPLDHEPGDPSNLLDRSPLCLPFIAEIAGEPADPIEVWHRHGKPITADEYNFRVAELRWAKEFAPEEPLAQLRQRPDLTKAEPIPP